MARMGLAAAVVFEKLREFERVASMLEMPDSERLGILNVTKETYTELRTGETESFQYVKPELDRRLSYALPLMRRLASNNPGLRMPPSTGMAAA